VWMLFTITWITLMIRVILVSPMVRLREWLVCGLPTEKVVKAADFSDDGNS
jgi:hypothetical protein